MNPVFDEGDVDPLLVEYREAHRAPPEEAVPAWDERPWKRERERLLRFLGQSLEMQTAAMREDMANDYLASTKSKREYDDFVQRYHAGMSRYAEDWTAYRDRELKDLEARALADKLAFDARQREARQTREGDWPYDEKEVIGDGVGRAGLSRGMAGPEGPWTLEPERGED